MRVILTPSRKDAKGENREDSTPPACRAPSTNPGRGCTTFGFGAGTDGFREQPTWKHVTRQKHTTKWIL
jgi:hypothetical protein